MRKPRDTAGNDFIAPCSWLAGLLFMDKFKRKPTSSNGDSYKMRMLSSDLYSVVMRHWKKWDEK